MIRMHNSSKRLSLPAPYVLFHGIPFQSSVMARIHGARNEAAQNYAIDYGLRPTAFDVPPTGTPPATAAEFQTPESIVHLSQGGPVAPGPREDEYIYPYTWTPFAPAVAGAVVPRGVANHNFAMPIVGAGDDVNLAVLRFRWRGDTVKTAWNTTVPGVVSPGPYTLDLSGGGANVLPIIPGTVRIVAPTATGTVVARDWPWPTAVERGLCTTGRMIGEVDPGVDSTINYETGAVVITFDQSIVAAPNILADFEHDGTWLPLDIHIEFNINAL